MIFFVIADSNSLFFHCTCTLDDNIYPRANPTDRIKMSNALPVRSVMGQNNAHLKMEKIVRSRNEFT